jgi:nicotinate-nucleotide adenylyltransferase
MNIALFGTSANPPTIGHLTILQVLADRFDHVAVWAADNPFKSDQLPLHHRLQMLQLLIQEAQLPPDKVQLYTDLSHPHTLTTLERAQRRWPEAQFTLVVGMDVVPQLPHWYRASELLRQVRVYIVPRQGYSLEPADVDRLRQMGAQVSVADITPPAVSSTHYREHGYSASLMPSIKDYIEREQLYVWQDETTEKPPVHP